MTADQERVYHELESAVDTLAAIVRINWREEGRVVFKLTDPMGLMGGAIWQGLGSWEAFDDLRLDEIGVSIPFPLDDEEHLRGRCRLEIRHALERCRLAIEEMQEALEADEIAAKLELVERYLGGPWPAAREMQRES